MNKAPDLTLLNILRSIEDQHNFDSTNGRIELDGIIQQVLRILDDAIEKLKIAFIVPIMLGKKHLVDKCLSKAEYTELVLLHKEYQHLNTQAAPISLNEQMHKLVDFRLIKAVEKVYENRKVREIVPTLIDSISDIDKDLIQTLDELRRIAAIRMRTTATAELAREKIVYDIYHDNEKAKISIINLKKQLHDKEVQLKWKLTSKQAIILKYKDALKAKNWEASTKIKKEISKANERMYEMCASSLQRQGKLLEDSEKLKATFDSILKSNIIADKKSREYKNRHLLQLHGLIRKYDLEIGNKIKENEVLQNELADQRKLLSDFMVEFNAEEEEYNTIMQIKQEEERSAFESKLLLFMMNRAAKIIQRAWRKYRKAKRKAKGKGKGGKDRGKPGRRK